MRKGAAWVLMVTMMALSVGCASIYEAKDFNGLSLTPEKPASSNVKAYSGRNWGIYVLWIPILTGDTDKVVKQEFQINTTLLKDTVSMNGVLEMISRVAKSQGATSLEDVSGTQSSIWFAPLLVVFIKSASGGASGIK
ncbi:MAG: hypothetical protein V2A74_12840 [bacterium]